MGKYDPAKRSLFRDKQQDRRRALEALARIGMADFAGRKITDFFSLLKELNRELMILVVSHDLFTVSSYAKSIACVNKRLHYHQNICSTGELMTAYHSCSVEEVCPVEHVLRGVQIKPALETAQND